MDVKTIDAKTLKKWLDNGEAVLVDVREQSEYITKNIPGSVLVPLGTVSKKTLPGANGKKLVIHCGIGKRGGVACEKLFTEDRDLEIYNLEGGITAWEQAGYLVNKS